MINKTLMVQGTTSDAGKSTLVAAICRILAKKDIRVAPFKPQNMALNSAVTLNGGEIGRAQALQAQACFLAPHTDMNPVLIKPSSDIGAQIIVQGHVLGNMDAVNYHQFKPKAKAAVLESFGRLHNHYDAVIIEGAGSPAEINLREGDIANMGFAEEVDCPVIIIADIDKGGVFAHLVGTLALLSPSEQKRVKGFVINKFRGDIALLNPGLEWLEQRTNIPVLGVLPYLHDFYIDAEDAIDSQQPLNTNENLFKIVVPVFPRISNHTDFDPLRLHPSIDLQFASLNAPPPPCDLIILPGSKNVRQDFQAFANSEWPNAIKKHLRYGGKIIGICGGFQMLGQTINDPLGIEGTPGTTPALGFLPLSTTLEQEKTLQQKSGIIAIDNQEAKIGGYEIHHGISTNQSEYRTAITFDDNTQDGFFNADNNIFGCYLHGLFDSTNASSLLLNWAGFHKQDTIDINKLRENQLDRLAKITEQHLNVDTLFSIMSL